MLQAKLDELPLISQAQVLPAQNVSRQAANASAAASGVLPAQNTSAVLPGVGAVTGASNATAGAQVRPAVTLTWFALPAGLSEHADACSQRGSQPLLSSTACATEHRLP